jgi:CysZ protein
MKNALLSFKPSIDMIFKNKVNMMLALVPIVIGIILYYFLGSLFYEYVMGKGKLLIDSYLGDGTGGSIAYYIVAGILSVFLFFLVNWTFVLVVSILASPFNDILSERIEKQLLDKPLDGIGISIEGRFKKFFVIIFNEIKKVSFIISLSLLSLVFSFLPLLSPISIIITIILLSIEFIDYSWSRNDFTFGECLSDIKSNILGFLIGGTFFFILISIPIVNLFVPSTATSFFTVFWTKNHANSN